MSSAYIITYVDEKFLSQFKDKTKFVNFFIDIRSVCPQFFNDKLLKLIINDPESLDLFLRKSLFNFFKYIDYHMGISLKYGLTPRFFFFSDTGESQYHKQIDKDYKSNRRFASTILTEEEYIRSKQMVNGFIESFGKYVSNIPGIFHIHLHYFESDFMPYFIMTNYNFSQDELFIIKSRDKDLAQCLSLYPNVYQLFLDTKQGKVYLSNFEAIEFHFNKKKESGILPAHLIPLFLSIAGDSSDNVIGIKGLGYKKVYSLLVNSNIHNWSFDNFVNLTKLVEMDESILNKKTDKTTLRLVREHTDIIRKNLRLTDFKILCDNLPSHIIETINKSFRHNKYFDSTNYKDFVAECKQLFDENTYFYNIVNYLKNLVL